MSNFTLPVSTPNCAVTDPEGKHMQENTELAREEEKLHLQTLQILNKVQYSPRPSTLVAIFDYAQSVEEERRF
ncbi:hypothetical protein EG028_15245 [Chitinophaga barathri]|uniref:Uncharacterized protein n=2 Tax=Chitinophaga barathri TaxID=1647451 RepID=A0A3N4MF84_9BACT|nr:hypothetical protein EG028_15245 [Chitinophaga barathri]